MRKRNLFMAAVVALTGLFGVSKSMASNNDVPPILGKSEKLGSGRFMHGDAKSYGQAFGNGGSKRSNRLRYSHNAKLKRRGVC